MTRGQRITGIVLAAVCVAGLVLLALSGGRLALEVTAMVLLGVGGIGLMTGAFWIVGLSEDREREGR